MNSPSAGGRAAASRSGSHRHGVQSAGFLAGERRDDEMTDERRRAAQSSERALASPASEQRRRGSWLEKKMLGSGGFGQVTLWQHETSGDSIALKVCRSDLNEANKQRWAKEVKMMYDLRHPNLVTALAVPDCFGDLTRNGLAILGMEWCDRGSLRQCFCRPQNRCGLREVEVLLLMKDIAGAVEYLHDKRIIHRDIKPENIVLKKMHGRVIHKLIDLGYAKDLTHETLAKSFVGTFVYLAPELFLSVENYTTTVDYWNFGSIVYEAITGRRPFPDFKLSPITWHLKVTAKDKHDICMHKRAESNFRYSQDIFPPHWLTRPMEALLTDWLRLMLQLDPHMRGGVVESNRRPEAFNFLDRILTVNIVQFYCININNTVAFEASSHDCITVYQNQLAQEWQIPKENQLIFDKFGLELEPERLVLENVGKKASRQTEEATEQYDEVDYYVLDNRQSPDAETIIERAAVPPPDVKSFIMDDPQGMMSQEDCSDIWPLAMNFCQKQQQQCNLLLNGSKALLASCTNENTTLSRLNGELMKQSCQLEGIQQFFVKDLQQDIDMIEESLTTEDSTETLTKWRDITEEVTQMKAWCNVSTLEGQITEVNDQIKQIRSNRCFQSSKYDIMQNIVMDSKRLLMTVKRQAKELKDSQGIANCVTRCIYERNELIRQLFLAVRDMMALRSATSVAVMNIKETLEAVQKCRSRLSELQLQKQTELWRLVKAAQSASKNVSRTRTLSVSSSSELNSATSSIFSAQLASINRQDSTTTDEVIEETGSAMNEFSNAVKRLAQNISNMETLSLDRSDV
ncbi:inhibitor of nuclear factor kappa-B kinase subunit alpha-like isoform X2 [Corticium candelabrum]|uniref:inhibitor of nuclear factor kappa-B kinase subunit alpha-like isoform X2 n=1 Tax=Corticium candelabrum TaxID=121492 RepID=UPI002E260AE0|nr:inhibitor of nuclear factor kappa-B kinase subunit alpha-like isoform X2 [Corticium candelabrum]